MGENYKIIFMNITFTNLLSGDAIKDLMAYYRSTWPDQSVTPKLHMLEDHALYFLENWGSSFGLYGEQGVESLHATINGLNINYRSMHPKTRRMESMLKEHYMRVNPESKRLRPVKKTKLSL